MKESPPQLPPFQPLPPPETADLLQKTTAHLTTLQSHLPNIHHFKSKWSLINAKLTSIESNLADFLDTSAVTNSLSTAVISTLSATLSSAVSLAINCSETTPAPPDGKLRTQSEVDSLSSKLDNHLHDLLVLHRSAGAGGGGDVSAGGVPTSGREAVRAEARNLLTRLQIGTTESKNSAIDSLIELLNEDDKNVLIAVAQGIVPVLVKSLDGTTSFEMREKIVSVIARVSTVESSKHVLIAEGLSLLNHLIRVIESGTGFAKEKACVALQELSSFKENARAIGSCGGISSLLEICHGGTPSSQGIAAGVLKNLAQFEEIKENFIEENAIPVLISLSVSGTSFARENAVGCLANLVHNDETLKVLVVREGSVESLKSYWDTTTVGKCLEPAIELLKNLASYHPIGEILITQGFQFRLLPLFNCGVLPVRVAAADVVYELGFCSKARREMGECGCVQALVRMVDGKAVEEKEAASKALSRLLLCHCNRKAFRKEERGIVGTVQLLDPMNNKNLDKKWPVSVLATLVQSKKCRKLMVGAGACVYLQKLVDLDVDGAKKLLDSLGKGKLWGVFARP
ncbi:hypothetical protein RND81_13G099100 [Saponaria officinalis]|uniref:DUF7032 domain-containing protein n=1 Tax=Saponaria officinalis TaxID=3572 RepID=A0AAW1GZK2_SAPOF